MKKTFWLLTFFGCLFACSCHKTPVDFQNSFSCKVNGVDWKPEGGSNATGGIKSLNIDVGKYPYFNAISIDVLKQIRDSKTGDDLIFEGFKLAVDLELGKVKILGKSAGDYIYNFKNGCSYYYPDSSISNKMIVLDLDTLQRRIKGNFEFSATSPTCRQTLKVTEGQFEVKY